MIVYFFCWLLVPEWRDLIINPATGKVSQKNLFGVMGFYVGTILSGVVVLVQLYRNQNVDTAPLVVLTINGLGLGGLKVFQSQQNRKTADDDGPLTSPPPGPPPPLMPQEMSGAQQAEALKNSPE